MMYQITTATTYYFSSSTGLDSRTSAQAQNPATPWQTLTKLNSIFSSLNAGDNILFKRGDIFYGSITVNKSGTIVSPITLGAYGTGAKPIITGFKAITAWTNLGSNIWESTSAFTTLTTCNLISINAVNTKYGRMPKTGYYTIQSTNGSTTITDAVNLNSSIINWASANVASRTAAWHLDRSVITSVSGNTITFSGGMDYGPSATWGYFIQNHLSACTQQNDWCFIASTKKVRIYSNSTPVNVNIPTIDLGINLSTFNYITFDNLDVQGYNNNGVDVNGRTGITVANCSFSFIANVAVYSFTNPGASSLMVTNCNFSEINSGGVITRSSPNTTVQNSTFTNVGNLEGMAGTPSSGGDLNYTAIQVSGSNSKVLYNSITNTGYVGVRFDGDATLVQGNFIDHTTYIKDDGGGIYCYPNAGDATHTTYVQRIVRDNIILNAFGNPYGKPSSQSFSEAMCIYNDGTSSNVSYLHNTMAYSRWGLFSNAGTNLIVDSNTVYIVPNAGYGTGGSFGPAAANGNIYGFWHDNYKGGIDNCNFTNNIVVSAHTNSGIGCGVQTVALAVYKGSVALPTTWTASNNVYANPLDQTNPWLYSDAGTGSACKTLAQWQSQTSKDAGSTGSPAIVSDISKLRFIYNNTASSATTSLGDYYVDMKSVGYNGSITLEPYSSTVLIKVVPALLNLNLYLQGYYIGSGLMNSVLVNQGVTGSNATQADTITVELHSSSTPYTMIASEKGILKTDGTLSVSFAALPGSYYIVVKHRNTIQTWSANPVALNTSSATTYNFTTAANKAYAGNMIQIGSIWAMYTGDFNQDEFIDASDFSLFDNDSANGVSGVYVATDANGDGFVDASDFTIFDSNSYNGITAQYP